MRFANQVTLITAAGSGIGRATAEIMACEGAVVAGIDNDEGVTVNAIAPSRTLTERIRQRWEQQSPEEQAAEIARTPLRRIAEPVDQGRVICFLASGDADFVTGVTIDVTGGN